MTTAKYVFTAPIPSLTVSIQPLPLTVKRDGKDVKVPQEQRKITLAGSGEISVEDRDALAAMTQVQAYIAEGDLRFPGHKASEKLFGKNRKDKIERMNKLSAEQDERKEAKADREVKADEVDALQKENNELRENQNKLEARLAKLEKPSKTPSASKTPSPTPTPTPTPAAGTGTGSGGAGSGSN